ncbi:MAG TPA: hypothetical protein PK402_05925 [Tepidisphaeraceae bacterium]|nr:hypothetical protein [Tepidisphaeraceae bacterium]
MIFARFARAGLATLFVLATASVAHAQDQFVRPGLRLTFSASGYEPGQNRGQGSNGIVQVDIVSTDNGVCTANITSFGIDANTNAPIWASTSGFVGQGMNVSEYLVDPAWLADYEKNHGPEAEVNRLQIEFNGKPVTALRIAPPRQKNDQIKKAKTYDMATGVLLLINDVNSLGGVGTQQLVSARQVNVPWASAQVQSPLAQVRRLDYAGQTGMQMQGGGTNCRVTTTMQLEPKPGFTMCQTVSAVEYNPGQPYAYPATTAVYSTSGASAIWVDPNELRKVQPGTVGDQDPHTGVAVRFEGEQNGMLVVSSVGPQSQTQTGYDAQSGLMMWQSSSQRNGNAVSQTNIQLVGRQ